MDRSMNFGMVKQLSWVSVFDYFTEGEKYFMLDTCMQQQKHPERQRTRVHNHWEEFNGKWKKNRWYDQPCSSIFLFSFSQRFAWLPIMSRSSSCRCLIWPLSIWSLQKSDLHVKKYTKLTQAVGDTTKLMTSMTTMRAQTMLWPELAVSWENRQNP